MDLSEERAFSQGFVINSFSPIILCSFPSRVFFSSEGPKALRSECFWGMHTFYPGDSYIMQFLFLSRSWLVEMELAPPSSGRV
uniref:Uncharacterized protein n=1 Tax=Anguilla anguilla TaxID=7936 RepID=A0A0E9TLI2_ANGAN